MTFDEFLERLIDQGIAAARRDYARPSQGAKLRGSVEGFEACRGRSPAQIKGLLEEAERSTREARDRAQGTGDHDAYWRVRCREAEIEWVANCVSVVLAKQGLAPIVPPTARALMTVAAIVGVAGEHQLN